MKIYENADSRAVFKRLAALYAHKNGFNDDRFYIQPVIPDTYFVASPLIETTK